jgi:hypothetical protein
MALPAHGVLVVVEPGEYGFVPMHGRPLKDRESDLSEIFFCPE